MVVVWPPPSCTFETSGGRHCGSGGTAGVSQGVGEMRESGPTSKPDRDGYRVVEGAHTHLVSPSSARCRGCHVLAGVDVVDIERFRSALARQPRLRGRLFSQSEMAYAESRRDPVRHLAVRFAAKEAVGKLLGCGVTSWRDICVESDGAVPGIVLAGRAAERARELRLGPIALSLSHTATIAVASAVAFAEDR